MATPPVRTRTVERTDSACRTVEILDQLDVDQTAQGRQQLLDALVCAHMGVARAVAARYRNRGIGDDDLEQVAYLALVRAARSYDRASGHDFMSYAVPSIRGEVRRHFRDHGWMVRPPRRVQELQHRIAVTESELSSSLGRRPTAGELAGELGETTSDVEEAVTARACFAPASLDGVSRAGVATLAERIGRHDAGLDAAEARMALAPAVRRLTDRERKIIELRFFRDCTQQEIADAIGVTQMQVSRLLVGLLARLRAQLGPACEPETSRAS